MPRKPDIPADYVDVDHDVTALKLAEQTQKVLELRAQGKAPYKIAEELGLTPRHVFRLIREAANNILSENDEFVRQRIFEHDSRYEYLYQKCVEAIERSCALAQFDANAVRAAVAVLDRQARLLGLDKSTGASPGNGRHEWLEKATPGALIREAERLGLHIPEPFKVAAGVE